jgi:uncharacterized protein DUF1801
MYSETMIYIDMSQNKTTENNLSVNDFIETVADPIKRQDSNLLVKIMEEATGMEAKMWGTAIIGFGSYHYKYESGREGDAPLAGFSPRANAISLYTATDPDTKADLLSRFGKFSTGKSCIYVKRLEDIDLNILKELVRNSVAYLKEKYPVA